MSFHLVGPPLPGLRASAPLWADRRLREKGEIEDGSPASPDEVAREAP